MIKGISQFFAGMAKKDTKQPTLPMSSHLGLKSILSLERTAAEANSLNRNDTTYSMIDAPPPDKPCKKYSDYSGLPAKYRDPITTLRYNNTKEYNEIQSMSTSTINGYLLLRNAK